MLFQGFPHQQMDRPGAVALLLLNERKPAQLWQGGRRVARVELLDQRLEKLTIPKAGYGQHLQGFGFAQIQVVQEAIKNVSWGSLEVRRGGSSLPGGLD